MTTASREAAMDLVRSAVEARLAARGQVFGARGQSIITGLEKALRPLTGVMRTRSLTDYWQEQIMLRPLAGAMRTSIRSRSTIGMG
ncbi:hypothetical protein [Microbispora sp. H10670]|uniref:hypothetical protein n=1 Tax=Microbispora sp. H10670 TaxID=2729108 RepID=UPI001600A3BD|nr:hypothetical protein [Microbispora sp. H10670]